mmetsp:Transcript_77289/g.202806  ORF Transcript_77289/g.202806 Transcript_77289/m.202806 type:complete len:212 (-) Transcript_77289:285-920(-)
MRSTCSGIWARSMVMSSSSPGKRSLRSLVCSTPHIPSEKASTAPKTCPSFEKKTAAISMSTSSWLMGRRFPPTPTESRVSLEVWGRHARAPFSITNETFWTFGACGISLRIRSPMVGSRMSKKWDPPSAGSLTSKNAQVPSSSSFIMATTSAPPSLLDSSLKDFMGRPSSNRTTWPLSTWSRFLSLYTATTKITSFTCGMKFFSFIQICSS